MPGVLDWFPGASKTQLGEIGVQSEKETDLLAFSGVNHFEPYRGPYPYNTVATMQFRILATGCDAVLQLEFAPGSKMTTALQFHCYG